MDPSSKTPVGGPLPAVPKQNQTPLTEEMSSSHQSGDGLQPVVLQTKETPMEDVSSESPKTAQPGLGLQSTTDVSTSLPPKLPAGGGRAVMEAARQKIIAQRASPKAITTTVAKRAEPSRESMNEVTGRRPPKPHPGGVRGLIEEKRQQVNEWLAQKKAIAASATARDTGRPDPNPESMTDVDASLQPMQHPGGIKAFTAEQKRQQEEWKASQNATAPTVAKRPAPASEDRPNKRLQGRSSTGQGELPDAGVEPQPFNLNRHNIRFRPCFARVTFPDSRGTIYFGSAFRQSKGTAAKVKVLPGRWGDPSVSLKMSVNKNGLNEDLASEEDKISNLNIVWQPYHVLKFTFGLVVESEHLKHPRVEEQAKQAGMDSSRLVYVRMVTNSAQITSPYEAEYWRLLTRKGDVAPRNMAICASFMSKTQRDTNVTVEFWFSHRFSTSRLVSLIGDSFKRCVDEYFPDRQHYQGPDRTPVPEYQGGNHALDVPPVDPEAGARLEPTPFRPGDKVAKLVREGWSIMEAIGKVFGEVASDSVELPGQSEAAAQDATNVGSSNPFHLRLGDEARGEVSEIAQKSREMALEPKTTQGETSSNLAPRKEKESGKQRLSRLQALVDQGWSYEAATQEVFFKLLPADE